MTKPLKPFKVKFDRCGPSCSFYRPVQKQTDIGILVVNSYCHHWSFDTPQEAGTGEGFPEWCPLEDWCPDSSASTTQLKAVK